MGVDEVDRVDEVDIMDLSTASTPSMMSTSPTRLQVPPDRDFLDRCGPGP